MSELVFSNPLFGLSVSILSYALGVLLQKRIRLAICNPLLVSYCVIMVILLSFHIPYDWYNKGGNILAVFLTPATASLAINVYRQRAFVQKYAVALFTGTFAGSVFSLSFIFLVSKWVGLSNEIAFSLLPKSITTAMALAVAETIGGVPSICVVAVVITGVLGNMLSPVLIRVLGVKNPVVQGIAIGTSSHAIGTAKANEMGEVQGALSSVALVLSGIITYILAVLFFS